MSINSSYRKHILYTVLVLTSFLYDLMLGVLQYPILTLAVCAILILYERVSPFIYTSR
jgi:hypothetical protein